MHISQRYSDPKGKDHSDKGEEDDAGEEERRELYMGRGGG